MLRFHTVKYVDEAALGVGELAVAACGCMIARENADRAWFQILSHCGHASFDRQAEGMACDFTEKERAIGRGLVVRGLVKPDPLAEELYGTFSDVRT